MVYTDISVKVQINESTGREHEDREVKIITYLSVHLKNQLTFYVTLSVSQSNNTT